jgi:FSR family fosmidomycin resistance protein-like MFS transporter
LLIVGGLGIAAFHPEAAAMAGSCAPEDRSRAMSIFAVGGYLGQAAGPVYSGKVTTDFGLPALAWAMVWGFPLVGLLVLGLGRSGPADVPARERDVPSLAALFRGRGFAVALILLIGTLRVLPAIGIPLALAYMLKARQHSNEQVGIVQSVFLAAIGVGSLACALFVRRARERTVLWLLPVAVAPAIAVSPGAGALGLMVSMAFSGLLLGATMPILVGYGQRLMPEGQRVASSITMGLTWGIGGMAVALIMTNVNRVGRPDLAFLIFAVSCIGSSVCCAWLPEPSAAEAAPQLLEAGRAVSMGVRTLPRANDPVRPDASHP